MGEIFLAPLWVSVGEGVGCTPERQGEGHWSRLEAAATWLAESPSLILAEARGGTGGGELSFTFHSET